MSLIFTFWRSCFLYSLVGLCFCFSLLSTSDLYGQSSKSFSRYNIEAILDPTQDRLYCTQNILIKNTFTKPNSRFYFRLANRRAQSNDFVSSLANDVGYIDGYSSDAVTIQSVTSLNGADLTPVYVDESEYIKLQKFSSDHLYFYVDTPRPVMPGRTTNLVLSYTVNIPKVYNNLYAGDEKWVYDDSYFLRLGWYPVEVSRHKNNWQLDQYRFAYHFMDSFSVTLPNAYTVHIPGNKQTETRYKSKSKSNSSKTSLKTVSNTRSYPVVSTPIVFSKKMNVLKSYTSTGKSISVYFLSDVKASLVQKMLGWAKEIFEAYESKYGPRPFNHLTIVNTPFPQLWGMAGDETIFLGDGMFRASQLVSQAYFERTRYYLLAHEIGHLWSGIGTVTDFDSENVFSEGLTDYLTHDLFVEKFGTTGNLYSDSNPDLSKFFITLFTENALISPSFTLSDGAHYKYQTMVKNNFDMPAVSSQEDRYLNSQTVLMYDKGLLIFNTLENYVGKPNFTKALRAYFQKPHSVFSNADEFKRYVTKYSTFSSEKITMFFDQWFNKTSQLDYSIDKHYSGIAKDGSDGYISRLLLKKEGDAPSNVDVKAIFEDGTTQTKTITDAQDLDVVSFKSDVALDFFHLDPDNSLIETSKMNNLSKPHFDVYLFGFTNQLINRKPLTHYSLSVYPAILPFRNHYKSDVGGGVSLVGTDYLNHNWQLGTVSGVDSSSSTLSGFYQTKAAYTVKTGRGRNFTLGIIHDTRDLYSFSLNAAYPIYSAVDSGLYGQFMYPELTLNLGVSRSNFGTDDSVTATTFGWSYMNLRYQFMTSSSFWLAPPLKNMQSGYAAWDTSSLLPFKMMGQPVILSASTGYARSAPTVYQYSSSSLRGNTSLTAHTKLLKFGVDLPFTVLNGLYSPLFNSIVFRSINAALFSEVGTAWSSGISDWIRKRKVTGGVEFSFLFSTFADQRFPLTFGAAYTLSDPDSSSNSSTSDYEYYLSITSPLSIFNMAYGY